LDKWAQSHIDVHVDIVDNLTVPALEEKQQEEMSLASFSIDKTTPVPSRATDPK